MQSRQEIFHVYSEGGTIYQPFMPQDLFKLSNFCYELPKNFIAQEPLAIRDSSRLLIVSRKEKSIKEKVFKDLIDLLNPGDILVLNDTRVIRAKIQGVTKTGSKIEILLLKEIGNLTWEVLVKPGRRAKIGESIIFAEGFSAKIIDKTDQGSRILEFSNCDFWAALEKFGKAPLPPYIKKDVDDFEKYQTVFAEKEGAIAAPTAGFHFTPYLFKKIQEKGASAVFITLHCGLGTFRPVKCEDIRNHDMTSEWVDISEASARTINTAIKSGSRIIAVGTTSVRSLESAACKDGNGGYYVKSLSSETRLYITPGYKFKIVDAIITNFHTPCSTNLILVSTFCGQELIKTAYDYAIGQKFRFYSFGDAMFIG